MIDYKEKAVCCVRDTVLPLHKGQFDECGRCLDEQYRRYGSTELLNAKVLEPGRVYEIGYPECVCPEVLSGVVTDPVHCECSRQSVLYILGELIPDKKITVETIETVLGGAEKCRSGPLWSNIMPLHSHRRRTMPSSRPVIAFMR